MSNEKTDTATATTTNLDLGESPSDVSGAAATFEAAREAHQPRMMQFERGGHDAAPFLVIPDRMKAVDLKAWLDARRPAPERARGTARIASLGSFVAHVNRFKDDGSAVFADATPAAPSLTAVYDYHRPGAPRWGQHRAEYRFPLSAAWRAWTGAHGKPMDQGAFAAFIEAHTHEVAATTHADVQAAAAKLTALGLKLAGPSEVLTCSRGIAVSVETTVERSEVLTTGETRILYDEKLKGEKGAALTVPGAFVVGVPVFDWDDELAPLPVRLRLRVKDGHVLWTVDLLNADDVLRDALTAAVERVADATGLPVYQGSPEA